MSMSIVPPNVDPIWSTSVHPLLWSPCAFTGMHPYTKPKYPNAIAALCHTAPSLPAQFHVIVSAYIPHTNTRIPTQSRWTPGPSPETIQFHWSPCAFTGTHLQSHWVPRAFTRMHPHIIPQSRCPPQPFSPIPCFYTIYLTRDNMYVLARCGVQPSGILVALWPTCVVLSRYVRSPVAGRGPHGLPSPRIFMFLKGMKAAFEASHSPGPWRARRLDSAV